MASDSALSFDVDALAALSASLKAELAAIGQTLDGLAGTARGLRAQWTGEANEAFSTAHSRWGVEFERMSAILQLAIDELDAATQDYTLAEKTNEQRWPG